MVRMRPKGDEFKRFEVRVPSKLLEELDKYLAETFEDWNRPSRNMYIVQAIAEKLKNDSKSIS